MEVYRNQGMETEGQRGGGERDRDEVIGELEDKSLRRGRAGGMKSSREGWTERRW